MISYRRAVPEDTPRIAEFLACEYKLQKDLCTTSQPTEGNVGYKLREGKKFRMYLGEESGEIVGVVEVTLGIIGIEGRDVKMADDAFIVVSGWKNQKQRMERFRALIAYSIEQLVAEGVEYLRGGQYPSVCMGTKWMAKAPGWTAAEITGTTERHSGKISEILEGLSDVRGT